MIGTKSMTRKFDESVIDAEDIINLGLLKEHTHMITGDINDESVDKAIRWLLYENATSDTTPKTLTLYINSTGGSLTDSFALIDIMRRSKFVVQTIAIGNVMSSAFLVFSAGDKGHRYVSKNTSGMCHQFTDSMDSKYHDIKSAMKESESLNERMIGVLVETTGLPRAKVRTKLLGPSDIYLSAEEMIEFGVADHILE
jgi:ATP-dependent Clp protease protease subunit